jgi:hypothetical protein
LGSIHTNPWVSLFDEKLNFRLEYTPKVDQSFVLNEQPFGNEQKRYLNGSDTAANYTYGTIAYLPSLDGAGHTLIIQGLNMAGTQAAAQILFNATAMKPILEKASLPDGSLKSFEALIETSSIGAAAPTAEIIATRFYMWEKLRLMAHRVSLGRISLCVRRGEFFANRCWQWVRIDPGTGTSCSEEFDLDVKSEKSWTQEKIEMQELRPECIIESWIRWRKLPSFQRLSLSRMNRKFKRKGTELGLASLNSKALAKKGFRLTPITEQF